MATTRPRRQVLARIPLRELHEGVTSFQDVIVLKTAAGTIQAIRNRCRHAGGRFRLIEGTRLTCPKHGWQLDLATRTYLTPAGGITHPCLEVEIHDEQVVVFESVPTHPWLDQPRPVRPLAPGEFLIRFYAHACVEIICGPIHLVTDPWLIGPAFSRGWWLLHEPPPDWRDRLAGASAIYISHNHSDHLSRWTLEELARVNPHVPVYVPEFVSTSCQDLVARTGMRDIRVMPIETWVDLDADTRFMILPDGAGRNDSGLLVEFNGHRLVNNVDCANLANGEVPTPVDVLLCQFTSGACEYPVCFPEQYSPAEIADTIAKRHANMLERGLTLAKRTQAACVIPFAGYFTEAHPADLALRAANVKQAPQRLQEHLATALPQVTVWLPDSGAVWDVATSQVAPIAPLGRLAQTWDFATFLAPMEAALEFPPLQTMEGIRRYFDWAGFRGVNLVLQVEETTEAFDRVLRAFLVDFLDLFFPAARPLRSHRFLRMTVRADVFRYVLKEGLPWEEISIGFQARFWREPDAYNFDLWDHFQNNLPPGGPDWTALTDSKGTPHVQGQ